MEASGCRRSSCQGGEHRRIIPCGTCSVGSRRRLRSGCSHFDRAAWRVSCPKAKPSARWSDWSTERRCSAPPARLRDDDAPQTLSRCMTSVLEAASTTPFAGVALAWTACGGFICSRGSSRARRPSRSPHARPGWGEVVVAAARRGAGATGARACAACARACDTVLAPKPGEPHPTGTVGAARGQRTCLALDANAGRTAPVRERAHDARE